MARRSEAIWIDDKKYWMIKVQKNGVRKAFYSGLPGRKGKHEAESKADEWLELGLESMRFSQAWEEFISAKRATTSRSYSRHLSWCADHIVPVIGARKLGSISPAVWQSVLNRAAQDGLAYVTVRELTGIINSFVHFCQRQRWQVQPLLRGDLTVPKQCAPKKQKHVLDPSEMRSLFLDSSVPFHRKMARCHYIYAFRFLVATGLRRGELCGLRREDITAKSITVNRSINDMGDETPGKNANARRTFALTDTARSILADQAEMLRQLGVVSPWVFPDPSGDRTNPKHLYAQWRRYCSYHGITSSLHELRHTFISIAKSDLPLELLKAVVGHSESMDTIGIYGHEIDGDQERAAGIIDRVLSAVIPEN